MQKVGWLQLLVQTQIYKNEYPQHDQELKQQFTNQQKKLLNKRGSKHFTT